MALRGRGDDWEAWMRAANRGDEAAYRTLLSDLAPALRAMARRGFARVGASGGDVEDVVQETLLAIHLKRHTWDESLPIGPWIGAIARNKVIDSLRQRGRRIELPLDDFVEVLPAAEAEETVSRRDVDRLLEGLGARQREVVRAVSVEGASIRETGARLNMSEGAVRVALHRGLSALAAMMRKGSS